jgi:hypothetical protein
MREEDYKAFLEHFPANKRSLIMNQFCEAYRSGSRSVDSILEWVKTDARMRCMKNHLSDFDEEIQTKLFNLCCDDPLAIKMAEYVIWWEELDYKTKDEIRRARQAGYVNQHMAVQPPTEKQLKYLEALGCKKLPKSKLEASNLIEEYLNAKRNRAGQSGG